ncbi:hypothetical protein M5J15_12265 [Serratia symbiotica]|uniref:hypothetical protein n=1 Tax=Serratia symbiotica TaxID=138074 RepID=UPI001D5F0B35|nr:hypothetical protein [Serratia symbiotica]NIG88411.1 hypothetical protein [Serratia symbiotica]USS95285.1 hypothetical protein M5J15_12265 [Serratia symbiotica]
MKPEIAARRLNAFSSLGLNIALGGGLPVDRIAKTQTPGASSKTCPVAIVVTQRAWLSVLSLMLNVSSPQKS